jgi:hypothetical protein
MAREKINLEGNVMNYPVAEEVFSEDALRFVDLYQE